MEVLSGASSSVENFVGRCQTACSSASQPRIHPVLLSTKLRHAEFRKQSSPFTDLSRKSLHRLLPLRLPPGVPRSSQTEDSPSNSDDGENSISPGSSSGSQGRPPYTSGDNNLKNVPNKKDQSSNSAKSAMERAAAYKKMTKLGTPTTPQSGQSSPPPARPATDLPQVDIIRGQNVQSRLQPLDPQQLSSPLSSPPTGVNVGTSAESIADVEKFIEEKMAAARVLPNSKGGAARPSAPAGDNGKQEPILLTAFERAKAYKQQQTEMVAALRENESPSSPSEGSEPASSSGASDDEKVVEIEIITRDGVIKRKLMNPDEQIRAFSNTKDVKRTGVSGIDFAGLGFADKKKTGRPAGLSESFAAPPTGALPEVEILTRDAGSSPTEREGLVGQDTEQLYKPRISTWGVFPRPADISKTFGGGRTIRPGESLETEEERLSRELHTRQLLADYRKKMGLDVDPKIKAEAEQTLKQGDRLMDTGRLREALPFYDLAMNMMPAQSELYGVAALQAAVCLDSMSSYDEARQVYEKLLAHPNGRVRKEARRFLFGFQAMEKLKVDGGVKWDTSPYRKYFDTFADGYNTTYKANTSDEMSENLLPYAALLLFPILVVFALAASKGG